MTTTPHDIIVQATDLLGQDVTLYIADAEAFGGVYVRKGTIKAVSETGQPHLVVENYRWATEMNELVVPRTIIMASEIIEIRA